MKRASLATAAIIGASSVFLASPASAHANDVKAISVCNKDTGKFDLTWTIANDHPLTETATSRLGSVNIAGTGTEPQHESVDAGSYTLNVHGVWSDGYEGDASGSVTTSGDCAPPVVVPPKPKDDSETRDTVQPPNCELRTVTTDHQERSRTYTLEGNEWVAGEWSDWSTTSTDTREAAGDECLTTIAVPAEPKVTDKCGPDNAAWVIPADGGGLHWVNEDGFLNAVTDEGYVLADGKFYHEFGIAPESNTEACPVKTPPTDTPETAAVLPDTGSPASLAGLLGAAGLIAAGVGLVRKGARA